MPGHIELQPALVRRVALQEYANPVPARCRAQLQPLLPGPGDGGVGEEPAGRVDDEAAAGEVERVRRSSTPAAEGAAASVDEPDADVDEGNAAAVAVDDPLADVGLKDITAHVNFSGIALAAQEAGFEVLGYTSQARFLVNAGLPARMQAAQQRGDWPALAAAQKLLAEHEMGELFKVLGLVKGVSAFDSLGFSSGDRSHRL